MKTTEPAHINPLRLAFKNFLNIATDKEHNI